MRMPSPAFSEEGFQIGSGWMALSANEETTERAGQSQRSLEESV